MSDGKILSEKALDMAEVKLELDKIKKETKNSISEQIKQKNT